MKNATIAVLVLIILAGAGFYFYQQGYLHFQNFLQGSSEEVEEVAEPVATTTPAVEVQKDANESFIGKSVEGRDISVFTFGSGEKKVLFVGGIHGGYEWNTVAVAYDLIDHLKANPSDIPENVQVAIVPVMNPDGLYKVVGSGGRFDRTAVPTAQDVLVSGRFNANGVDLNRNFDCDWKPTGMWQNRAVEGGSAVFSEPESAAMKQFVETYAPTAVVGWYSAAGGVYSSSCGGSILPATKALTGAYAKASGYKAYDSFDSYAITGDMENWLAKIKIPAISVLLTDHTNVEWEKNLAGVKAVLAYFTK